MARIKGPAADQAYEIILNRILSFDLLPGDAVSDHTLAFSLEMSRTPIREAMQRLVHEGLITSAGTRWVVSSLSLQDIAEICQVREALESKAVELIFRQGGLNESQLEHLRELNRQMRKYVEEKDYEHNFACDDRFHAAILIYSQNGRLIELFGRLRLQILRARWLTVYRSTHTYQQSLMDHDAIIRGIESGDMAVARACIERHMRSAEENFSQIFSNASSDMPLKSLNLLGFTPHRK
ncbi:MAG: GntR family transcriptional regulator [Clostridiales bacterium]|nr:GntR family transcriptional regulator [Clostridiales bacterium]